MRSVATAAVALAAALPCISAAPMLHAEDICTRAVGWIWEAGQQPERDDATELTPYLSRVSDGTITVEARTGLPLTEDEARDLRLPESFIAGSFSPQYNPFALPFARGVVIDAFDAGCHEYHFFVRPFGANSGNGELVPIPGPYGGWSCGEVGFTGTYGGKPAYFAESRNESERDLSVSWFSSATLDGERWTTDCDLKAEYESSLVLVEEACDEPLCSAMPSLPDLEATYGSLDGQPMRRAEPRKLKRLTASFDDSPALKPVQIAGRDLLIQIGRPWGGREHDSPDLLVAVYEGQLGSITPAATFYFMKKRGKLLRLTRVRVRPGTE